MKLWARVAGVAVCSTQLALAQVASPEPVTVPAASAVESHAGFRAAGWVVFFGSLLGGGALVYAALRQPDCGDDCGNQTQEFNVPLGIAGLSTWAVGLPIGGCMMVRPDTPIAPRLASARAAEPQAPTYGFALRGRF